MGYRIDETAYEQIRNDCRNIQNIEQVAFDILIDSIVDWSMSPYVDNPCVISFNTEVETKQTVIAGLFDYLVKTVISYSLLVSKQHKIACMILQRTILETTIKIQYFVTKDDIIDYQNYIANSLVSEKLYQKALEQTEYIGISDDFIQGTKESISRAKNESNIESFEEISRRKNPFPSIEKMCEYLMGKGVMRGRSVYDIAYRTTSNFTHANWSAVVSEKYHHPKQYCDWRLLIPLTQMIHSTFLYVDSKLDMLSPDSKKRIAMYLEVLEILDSEGERRHTEK